MFLLSQCIWQSCRSCLSLCCSTWTWWANEVAWVLQADDTSAILQFRRSLRKLELKYYHVWSMTKQWKLSTICDGKKLCTYYVLCIQQRNVKCQSVRQDKSHPPNYPVRQSKWNVHVLVYFMGRIYDKYSLTHINHKQRKYLNMYCWVYYSSTHFLN